MNAVPFSSVQLGNFVLWLVPAYHKQSHESLNTSSRAVSLATFPDSVNQIIR